MQFGFLLSKIEEDVKEEAKANSIEVTHRSLPSLFLGLVLAPGVVHTEAAFYYPIFDQAINHVWKIVPV